MHVFLSAVKNQVEQAADDVNGAVEGLALDTGFSHFQPVLETALVNGKQAVEGGFGRVEFSSLQVSPPQHHGKFEVVWRLADLLANALVAEQRLSGGNAGFGIATQGARAVGTDGEGAVIRAERTFPVLLPPQGGSGRQELLESIRALAAAQVGFRQFALDPPIARIEFGQLP